MDDKQLRKTLVRLAHQKPELRGRLLPLIRTAAVKRPEEFKHLKRYTSSDLREFCDSLYTKNFLRMKTHDAWKTGMLLSSPMYALGSGLLGSFGGPVGKAIRERSLKPILAGAADPGGKILDGILRTIGPDNVLELMSGEKYAFITWITDNGENVVSVSFLPDKEKKAPGVGMKVFEITDYLQAHGLIPSGGGSQWNYYGLESKPGEGPFVRLGKRTIRLVWRSRRTDQWAPGRKGPLMDGGADREYAFGNTTPAMLDGMIEYVKKHSKGR